MILLSSIFTMFSLSVTIILFGRNPNPLKYPKRPSSSFYYLSEDLDVPSYFPFLVLLLFGSICVIYRYFIMKKPAKNVMIYKNRLKIGVFSVFFCTIAQRFAWCYMRKSFMIGLSLLCISDVLSMIFFVIFILEGTCSCNIKYRQWKEFLVFIMMFAVITTYTMANFIGNWYDLLVHVSCSVSISINIIDIHVLSCNQIRVKTLVQMRNNTAKPQENHLFLGDSFIV